MHDAVALGNAAAVRTIEADGMDLIEIRESVIFFREIANGADRSHVAVHRVDALESDDLRRLARNLLQLGFEIAEVVVQEDLLRPAAIADTGDHRGVILLVRKDDAAGKQLRQRREGSFVGNECRGKEQRRFLAVEAGKLVLEFDVIVRRSGDVARSAGACADEVDRLVHCGEHLGMLAHAEVVV